MLTTLILAALTSAGEPHTRPPAAHLQRPASDTVTYVRINQVGYLPDAPKVAVACSLDSVRIATFIVQDENGRTVLGPRSHSTRRISSSDAVGQCAKGSRLGLMPSAPSCAKRSTAAF